MNVPWNYYRRTIRRMKAVSINYTKIGYISLEEEMSMTNDSDGSLINDLGARNR